MHSATSVIAQECPKVRQYIAIKAKFAVIEPGDAADFRARQFGGNGCYVIQRANGVSIRADEQQFASKIR